MNQLVKLTDDKFNEIYSDPEFRNQVAFAHRCYDQYSKFIHLKTCSYPIEYIVTETQIELAKKECDRAKKEALKNQGNKLIFIGMGMNYAPRYEGDVCNHRIRTEFKNKHGHKFFIELGTCGYDGMRIDHSIDRDLQDQLNDDVNKQSKFYNYKGLQRKYGRDLPKYTKEGVLRLINREFDCCFTEMVVDSYTLSPEDLVCLSPK